MQDVVHWLPVNKQFLISSPEARRSPRWSSSVGLYYYFKIISSLMVIVGVGCRASYRTGRGGRLLGNFVSGLKKESY